MAAKKLDKT